MRSLIVLCIFLAVIIVGGPALAQSAEELAAARKLCTEALLDERDQRYEIALAKFQRVRDVKDTAAVRYRIGACQEGLGKLRDAAAARELSHAFFEQILGGGRIQSADQSRGRFRSYLLGAVKHFVANERQAETRKKRGGGIEAATPEEAEAVRDAGLSPDAAFERQWALTVLARAMEALEGECAAGGRTDFFQAVKPLLTGDADHGGQAEVAEACGMNIAALRMAVHRLRRKLRDLVKAEIAGTLDNPALVQEEMQALFAALGG